MKKSIKEVSNTLVAVAHTEADMLKIVCTLATYFPTARLATAGNEVYVSRANRGMLTELRTWAANCI